MALFWSLHAQKHDWIINFFHFPQYRKPQDIYFRRTIFKTVALSKIFLFWKLNHNKSIRKWKDSSYGNKTVISPFSSNKNGLIVVYISTKWTYYSLQWYKKNTLDLLFFFFSNFCRFLGWIYLSNLHRRQNLSQRCKKWKKLNFSKFGLITLLNSIDDILTIKSNLSLSEK